MQAVHKGLEKVEQELTASENDGAISSGFRKVMTTNGSFYTYLKRDILLLTKDTFLLEKGLTY
jgi:hypothetical protein